MDNKRIKVVANTDDVVMFPEVLSEIMFNALGQLLGNRDNPKKKIDSFRKLLFQNLLNINVLFCSKFT